MDSEFLKEINCVYLSAKQVVCIRWIQNWIIGSEWFHIFVHNMEATVVSNLERSVAWEGFRPLKTGIEEVTRYVQISVSRLQRNHICFFPGKKSQIFKIDTVYTELFCCLYIRLQIKFLILFWHHAHSTCSTLTYQMKVLALVRHILGQSWVFFGLDSFDDCYCLVSWMEISTLNAFWVPQVSHFSLFYLCPSSYLYLFQICHSFLHFLGFLAS